MRPPGLPALALLALALACGGSPAPGGAPGPAISGVSPARATVGAAVSLAGAGFGATQGGSAVTIGGVPAEVVAWGEGEIRVTVPDVLPGPRPVAVTVGGAAATAALEVVLPRRLYACDDGAPNSVSVFAIAADGSLSDLPGSPFATGGSSRDYGGQSGCIRVHAPTRRLYAVNDDSVAVFAIDGATGALAPLPASPAPLGAARAPVAYSLEVSPDGTTVFVPDALHGEIAVARVAADGGLSEVAGSPFASSAGAASVAELRPDGAFLYVQPELGHVDVFSVAAGGALSFAAAAPYGAAGGFTLRRDPAGTRLAAGTDGVSVLVVAPATGIPALAPGAPVAGPTTVGGLAWTPDGARLYASDQDDGALHGWSVAADGALSPLPGSPWAGLPLSPPLPLPSALEISSDGAFLFYALEGAGIATFALGADGAPALVGPGVHASARPTSALVATP